MHKVLILDANQRCALAATRSLGAKGVHVVAADETPTTLAGSSRYCQESFTYTSPYEYPDIFISDLYKAAKERDIRTIFPMTEISTYLVLQSRESFKEISIPFAPFEVFDTLTDKWRLFEIAQQIGVLTPMTYFVDGRQELRLISSQLRFPVVLKPYRSKIWSKDGWLKATVKYVHSVQEMEEVVAHNACFNQHPFLVQEYISGKGQGLFALYDRGKPVAFFAHKRLREKPPSGGVSVLSESVEVPPRLYDMGRRILDYVQWHGVAMVEFKVADDGMPYLMEVNARFWGSLQLAIDAGIDFPWLLYQLAQGKTLNDMQRYTVGVRNRWLLGDFIQLCMVLQGDTGLQVTPSEKWRAVLQFLKFFQRHTRCEVNRWGDLIPFLVELKEYVGRQRQKKALASI
jgi:predicted ATP-grasp superfamily ATP-dependent carboligase